ncbi:PbrT family lead (Pb2+) uptake porter [Raineyella fluvialis]|uniref:PbrT family lead (Pb2+) uptake porter n=2 Tax=Raineyella fluvialis TaxID=2662261 RepID=A0A5Q2FDS7_9ACTN|nr:PbrT family lead (Pb2+) uptake porter [Raineyella fluvialis]
MVLLGGTALAVALTAGCTRNVSTAAPATGTGAVAVTSTDDACRLATTSVPAGKVTFDVTNKGTKVTEFYLYAADGKRILGEAENIAPGLTRSLVVTAAEGSYLTACKPGMTGDGIRAAFTVTASHEAVAAPAGDQELAGQAKAAYATYIRAEADQLLEGTKEYAELYKAGKDDEAREEYAEARTHWERMEPVAESFGDLDPRMDAREADLEPGQEWTGWHAMEKDLWQPAGGGHTALTPAQRAKLADQLVTDTEELHRRTRDMAFTLDQIGNGAKSLLDEVATGKVTGEEETWSHTDLWDFQANIDGAKEAYETLHPLLQQRNPQLDQEIDERFDALQALLDTHRKGDGFVGYDTLSKDQVKRLSDAVNALSEPLSRMTGAVL